MPHVNRLIVGPDGTTRNLVDRLILAFVSGYTVASIRKHLVPDCYDEATRVALYDKDRAVARLRELGVAPRPDTRGPRPGRHAAIPRPGA